MYNRVLLQMLIGSVLLIRVCVCVCKAKVGSTQLCVCVGSTRLCVCVCVELKWAAHGLCVCVFSRVYV